MVSGAASKAAARTARSASRNGCRQRAKRPLMPLGAVHNPPAKGRERFTSLPSATRRGIEKLCEPLWGAQRPGFQPLPFALLRSASFAGAKLKSAQSVTTSSGDTFQCGACFLRWWAPVSRVQGPLRCHPPPFGARAGEAGPVLRMRPRLSPLSTSARHPPFIARKPSSHWNGSPPRLGVHCRSAEGRALARRFIRAKARTPQTLGPDRYRVKSGSRRGERYYTMTT